MVTIRAIRSVIFDIFKRAYLHFKPIRYANVEHLAMEEKKITK